MTTRTWNGTNDTFTNAADWTPTGVPQSGDVAVINSGTVLLSNFTITGGLAVTVNNPNSYGTGNPILEVSGSSGNNGTLSFTGSSATFQFDTGATFTNNGAISIVGASPIIPAGSTTPTIVNNGSIGVTNPSNALQTASLAANISGTGTIAVGTNGKLDLNGAVSSGQTLSFTGGVNGGAIVQIDQVGQFAATVTGFVQGNTFDVANTPYTAFTYSSNGSSGTINIYNNATLEGQISLSGIYNSSDISAQYQTLLNGGSNLVFSTTVVNPTTGATASGTSTAATGVYRWFDTVFGTHFFTASAAEAAQVDATRSADLKPEVNDFGAVNPAADPAAEAVYRFFDKVNGTHFFTASTAERDQIIATRSDLSFESGATFYEDATQQAGDIPVYRLFDTVHGTQFLTGDAGEAASATSLLVPGTTQHAYTNEGVDFYAPSGSFNAASPTI